MLSVGRMALASATAAATSTRSPMSRPTRSLTVSKSSRSTIRSASCAGCCSSRSSALRVHSASTSRLRSPVSASWVARLPDRFASRRAGLPERNEHVAVLAATHPRGRVTNRLAVRSCEAPLADDHLRAVHRLGDRRQRVVAAGLMDGIEPARARRSRSSAARRDRSTPDCRRFPHRRGRRVPPGPECHRGRCLRASAAYRGANQDVDASRRRASRSFAAVAIGLRRVVIFRPAFSPQCPHCRRGFGLRRRAVTVDGARPPHPHANHAEGTLEEPCGEIGQRVDEGPFPDAPVGNWVNSRDRPWCAGSSQAPSVSETRAEDGSTPMVERHGFVLRSPNVDTPRPPPRCRPGGVRRRRAGRGRWQDRAGRRGPPRR